MRPYLSRRVVSTAATAACLVAATACASTSTSTSTVNSSGGKGLPFKMNLVAGSLVSLPLFVARDMGFFEKAGLKAQAATTNLSTSALQLLISGQLDLASADIPSTINANSTGAGLVIVSGGERYAPVALQCRKGVGATPGYPAGVRSLAGKSIGITAVGAASDTFVRIILKSAGVDPSKASLVPLGGVPNFIAAVKAKRVDCVMSFPPIQQELAGDVDTIVDLQKGEGPNFLTNAQYGVMATTKKFASGNPEVIRRFRTALSAADAFVSRPANAEAVATGVAKDFPGISHPDLVRLVKTVQGTFAGAETIPPSAFQDSVKSYNLAYGKNLSLDQSQLVLK
jgi:NitT/TauT family transport system substrate-binding protein